MLGQPLPFLWLRRQHKVEDVVGQKAKCAVVVLGPAFEIAAGLHSLVAVGYPAFTRDRWNAAYPVRAVAQQSGLDGVFKGAFGYIL